MLQRTRKIIGGVEAKYFLVTSIMVERGLPRYIESTSGVLLCAEGQRGCP